MNSLKMNENETQQTKNIERNRNEIQKKKQKDGRYMKHVRR